MTRFYRMIVRAAGLFVASGVFTACAVDAPTASKVAMRNVATNRPGSVVETALALTVDDAGPLGAYRITSDGLGEYVDGLQGVTAKIDGSGNLLISGGVPRTSTTPPERTFMFDFSAPVDPLNTYRPDLPEMNFKILSNPEGNPPIQNLGIGGNPSSGCYGVDINYTSQTTNYQVLFFNLGDPTVTWAYITRTSISPAVWTMVSNGPCPGAADQARVKSQDLTGKKAGPVITRGVWNMGFSMHFRQL